MDTDLLLSERLFFEKKVLAIYAHILLKCVFPDLYHVKRDYYVCVF